MKIGIDNGGNWTAEYYEATVVSANDYYPFGSAMAGRKFNDNAYRYGFNGMEKDDEVKGEGNSYTTEFRFYDSRVARWISLDPLMDKYSGHSPFVAFNNNPIYFNDPTGLEGDPPKGSTTFTVPTSPDKVDTNIWKELKADEGIERGHTKRWYNSETGQTLAFDKGKAGANGWGGKNHYHIYDKIGKRLTAEGKLAGGITKDGTSYYKKGASNSHLSPGQTTKIKIPLKNMTAVKVVKGASKLTKGASKVLVPVGIATSVYDIATAENKTRAVVKEASGWAGAEGGAAVCAAIGVWFGGAGAVPGAFIGGIVGGITGYFTGSFVGETAYDAAKTKTKN
jgi:RHS repeat-associated protein